MTTFIHSLENAIGIPASLGFACIAMIFASFGIVLTAANRKLALKFGHFATLLGGGVLVIIAITHLLPEALSKGLLGASFVIVGFSSGWLLDKVGHTGESGIDAMLFAPLIAIGVHSFLDGMVYVVSLEHSHTGGVFSALGLILHELPEGLLTLVLCLRVFKRTVIAIIAAFFVAGLSTPAGTIVGLAFEHTWSELFLDWAFPLSAGLVTWAGINLVKNAFSTFRKPI